MTDEATTMQRAAALLAQQLAQALYEGAVASARVQTLQEWAQQDTSGERGPDEPAE